jgi:hypothetical protein
MNKAYISHIIAAKENGPRGHKELSEQLELDFTNLMLLCDQCHNRIDEADPESHCIEFLQGMKAEHEERIAILTDIGQDKSSQIIIYKANIGIHSPTIDCKTTCKFLLPEHYPATPNAIELGLQNSPLRDKNESFWKHELEVLEAQYSEMIKPRLRHGKLPHISLFALAPIPLLIKLGTLINDVHQVEIYQPIRNPNTWKWRPDSEFEDVRYKVGNPDTNHVRVAINLSLSGNITEDRIHRVLGQEVSIFTVSIEEPFNDFMKCKKHLHGFSQTIRKLFNRIKVVYGAEVPINIFPAVPVSAAIEIGRVWMPKADMPLFLYDENTASEGFKHVLTISNK